MWIRDRRDKGGGKGGEGKGFVDSFGGESEGKGGGKDKSDVKGGERRAQFVRPVQVHGCTLELYCMLQ